MLPWKHGIKKSQLHYFNRIFLMAEQVLKDETCNTCGTPFWLGHSTNNIIGYKMKEETCEGCAEKERLEETERKANNEAGPGVTRYISAFSEFEEDGVPLPTRREWIQEQNENYLQEQRKKEKARSDGS